VNDPQTNGFSFLRSGLSVADLAHLTAVILVGGLGTRLRPTGFQGQKVLASIKAKPFLALLLEWLSDFGVRRAVLCTGYQGSEVEKALGEQHNSIRLTYSQEPVPLGTGGALRLALPLCPSNPLLVMNGDSFFGIDLRAFFTWHGNRKAPGSLALAYEADISRYGQVWVEDDGKITRFAEKGEATGAGWINGGIYLLSQSLVDTIPSQRPVSLERDMFPRWLADGLCGYQTSGRFIDIGTPESLASAEAFFADA